MAAGTVIYIGNIIHCKEPFQLEIFSKGFIIVENEIVSILYFLRTEHLISRSIIAETDVVVTGQFCVNSVNKIFINLQNCINILCPSHPS